MSAFSQLVRKEWIAPSEIPAATYRLAPIDIFADSSHAFVCWPLFFKYDIEAEQLIQSLKKICTGYPHLCGRAVPDPDIRQVVKVDPEKEGSHGFCFEECKSGMSIAAAVLVHGQLTATRSDFPVMPEIPFFADALDIDSMLKGDAPMVKMKLTHLTDGCVLNVTIAHLIVDGRSVCHLIDDIAAVYRGEEFPPRSHDRSCLWPDRVAQHYPFLGEEVAQLPKIASTKKETVGYPITKPDQPSAVECLYFSKEALDKLLAAANKFLEDGEQLSIGDALVTFCWMLACDVAAERRPVKTAADLAIVGTTATRVIDMLENGIDVVPKNYWGNSFVVGLTTCEGMDVEGKSIGEIFSRVAVLIRQTLTAIQEQDEVAAQSVLVYYKIVSSGSLPAGAVTIRRASVINLSDIGTDDINFGSGSPVVVHITAPIPMLGGATMIAPGPNNKGIMLHMQMTESQKKALKDSVVIQEFAPDMKLLYSDFTLMEFEDLIEGGK